MFHTISSLFARQAQFLQALILLNAVILVIGLFAPMLTIEKFVFLENTFSVVGGIVELLKDQQYLLFVLLFLFSIALPIVKIIILYLVVSSTAAENYQKHIARMHDYGKWSMLDVFVVAILVVVLKLDYVVDVQVHYGLYAFSVAVLLTMLITARVIKLTDACLKQQSTTSELPN